MTPAKLAAYVRKKTRTNSTTFPDADILIFLEPRYEEIARRVTETDENKFLHTDPESFNLSANVRKYALNANLLSRIKRIEAKLDGTNFIELKELDISQYKDVVDETVITNNFANLEGEARYGRFADGIFIYSGTISAVTGGLKIWQYLYPTCPTDLTSTTDMSVAPSATTHALPREMHKVLADGIVIDWKESQENPIPLSEREQSYEYHVLKALEAVRRGNMTRETEFNTPAGSEVWSDGYDL